MLKARFTIDEQAHGGFDCEVVEQSPDGSELSLGYVQVTGDPMLWERYNTARESQGGGACTPADAKLDPEELAVKLWNRPIQVP